MICKAKSVKMKKIVKTPIRVRFGKNIFLENSSSSQLSSQFESDEKYNFIFKQIDFLLSNINQKELFFILIYQLKGNDIFYILDQSEFGVSIKISANQDDENTLGIIFDKLKDAITKLDLSNEFNKYEINFNPNYRKCIRCHNFYLTKRYVSQATLEIIFMVDFWPQESTWRKFLVIGHRRAQGRHIKYC